MHSGLPPVARAEINIPADDVTLTAELAQPEEAKGLVLFAHGSGSSRHSPRNRQVAAVLNQASFATLLTDLITPFEEVNLQLRPNIERLTARLTAITDWSAQQAGVNHLPLGCFGAGTGAAAALRAAARQPQLIRALVSHGGRPDLAGDSLSRVATPSLFLIDSNDLVVLHLNRQAIAQLPHSTEYRFEIITGATHLFEEPGAPNLVAELARDWFHRHLKAEPHNIHAHDTHTNHHLPQHGDCT